MKKVICLILTIIVLCGQVSATGIYVPDDVVDTEYEDAYQVLTGLSIFDHNDDSSFRPLTPITRADFTIALGNIMKVAPLDGNMYFKDVPREHKAFDAVAKLTGYGIINGFEDKTFHPDENIKAVDAVTMLLLTMGYDVLAQQKGGYPKGYIQTAGSIGLLKGVRFDASGDFLRGDAAKMLLNALEIPVMAADFNGNYVIDDSKDLLYIAMGIKKINGTVQANNLYSVDAGAVARKNHLRIDNDIYHISNRQWEDMVGYNVTCYYYDNDGENEVVYLLKNDARIKEITISAKNARSFVFPYFSYLNEGSQVRNKITVSSGLCMIYNGIKKATVVASDFCPANGELNFIDIDSDGSYDIVNIRSYTNALVSSVTEDAIYISYPTNDKIETDNYESFTIYNMDGNIVDPLELKENDVISIYESIDKSVVSIVCSRKRIEGTISECYEEDGITKIIIDGVTYDVAIGYDSSFPNLTSVGTKGTFCLDASGDVYTMLGEKTNTRRYGYIIKLRRKRREDAYCVRLLEETGKVTERSLAKKVRVDGGASVSPDVAYGLIGGAVLSPVVYKTNRMGEINMLDTVLVGALGDDDRLNKNITGLSGMYRKSTMSFDVSLPIDENTKIFVIPDDPTSADENKFGFADYKILENETTYSNIDSYNFNDPKKLTADILVMKSNSSVNTMIGIVTGIQAVLNADDEIVTCYKLQTGEGIVSCNVTEERVSEEIQKITSGSSVDTTALISPTLRVAIGDLVKIYRNGDGEIEKISIIYDLDADTEYSNPTTNNVTATSFERCAFGQIFKIDRSILSVEVQRGTGKYEYYNLKGIKIYIFDSSDGSSGYIKEGRVGDLKIGGNIAVVTKGATPRYVFAY